MVTPSPQVALAKSDALTCTEGVMVTFLATSLTRTAERTPSEVALPLTIPKGALKEAPAVMAPRGAEAEWVEEVPTTRSELTLYLSPRSTEESLSEVALGGGEGGGNLLELDDVHLGGHANSALGVFDSEVAVLSIITLEGELEAGGNAGEGGLHDVRAVGLSREEAKRGEERLAGLG